MYHCIDWNVRISFLGINAAFHRDILLVNHTSFVTTQKKVWTTPTFLTRSWTLTVNSFYKQIPCIILHFLPNPLCNIACACWAEMWTSSVCFPEGKWAWGLCDCGLMCAYTAGKLSIEHVTIFLSKYISKDAIDMIFSPDVGNNRSNPYIKRNKQINSEMKLCIIMWNDTWHVLMTSVAEHFIANSLA